MASISFKNVTKTYDGAASPVVPNLNLEIKDKEFIILVGPSGCGKSTTLRMIAGLETVTEGEVYIGDRLVNKVPPKDRDIAMVFQNYALYPHMNVYKNIAFGLNLRKEDKAEIDRRVHEAAKVLDLEHLLERKPKELSGGQRQRIAIARALIQKKEILILDEGISSIDKQTGNDIENRILNIPGLTIINVSHDLQENFLNQYDEILFMQNGKIAEAGPYRELMSKKGAFQRYITS